ncbi:MAG: adenosine kinase [Simkaniaceae bacterium]|nr:MAG: adenosine kinase [Simkaniaceae bacterium]
MNFVAYGKSYDPEIPEQYEVLSLSAAIIDHYYFITDEELKSMTNEKGSWAPIDRETLSSILDKNESVSKMVTGGSGANVIKGLAQLGERCALIGKVGNDEKGEYYSRKLRDWGISPIFEKGSLPTGQAICLITPDGERTFRTYLGASHSLTDLKFDKELLHDKVRLFHIEGYQLVDRDLVIRTLKIAKESGVLISLDLANVEIVRRNKEFIQDILKKYIDIVFCNAREGKALTGLGASEACDKLADLCDVAVVTMSERGSWVRKGDMKIYMEALEVNAIDSTGAGDLYASGFLHGYLNGYSLKRCAWLGSLVSSHVVKRIGAEIPNTVWEEIRQIVSDERKAFD